MCGGLGPGRAGGRAPGVSVPARQMAAGRDPGPSPSQPPVCASENTCVQTAPRLQGGNHISSRLRIKQYLWAIVIKGKFNSLLMPHYAGLCEVTPGSCHRFNGTGGYREREGCRVVLGLSAPGPPGARRGPLGGRLRAVSDLVPGIFSSRLHPRRPRCAAAWCVLGQLWVLMLWPLPARQEALVPPKV